MNKQHAGSSASTHSDERNATSVQDSVRALVDQGSETVDAIKSRVGEARTKGSAAYARTSSLIKANPLKSVAIAFGVGYVAMRIRTSKLTSLLVIGGLGYLGKRMFAR